MSILLLLALTLGSYAAVQATAAPPPVSPSGTESTRDVLYSSQQEAIRGILVSIQSIKAHSATNSSWITIIDYGASPKVYDLLTLLSDGTASFGAFSLPPDDYTQIRLNLTPDSRVEVDGEGGSEFIPLDVPSSASRGVHPFTVMSDELMSTIFLNFDLGNGIDLPA